MGYQNVTLWVPNIGTITSLREGFGGKSPLSWFSQSAYYFEHRKQNVIVHGVPKSNEDSPEQRIEEDTTVLAAMFHEIGADDVKLESVVTVVRLGKRSDDPARPRPVIIVLDSVEGKVKLLRNAKKTCG